MTDVSIVGAVLAGLVSFLSPCVLPIVPGYVSMLSGIGLEQLRQGQHPRAGLSASALARDALEFETPYPRWHGEKSIPSVRRPKRKNDVRKDQEKQTAGHQDVHYRARARVLVVHCPSCEKQRRSQRQR